MTTFDNIFGARRRLRNPRMMRWQSSRGHPLWADLTIARNASISSNCAPASLPAIESAVINHRFTACEQTIRWLRAHSA